jgi:hypothetical protein
MRRIALALAPLAALLGLVLTAAPAQAGLSGAHFVSGPAVTSSGGTATVTAKEAGLGDVAQISVTFTATFQCINGGGNNPQASNKQADSVTQSFPVQNGHADVTESVTAVVDPSSPCPGPQQFTLVSWTYTDTTTGLSASG